MMHAIGVSVVTAALTTAAIAQEVSPFDTDDCPERKNVYRWCASRAAAAGWRLKYEIEPPVGVVDAWWATEIWVRGHEAMLCQFSSGRGGISANFCQALREVAE